MIKLRKPFFTVNPKSYLWGEKTLQLALVADKLAEKYDIDILYTGQLADMRLLKQHTKHLILTAQHLDGIAIGRGMGYLLPEAAVEAGVKATFLNHAEHPLSIGDLTKAVARAKDLGIITIICANTLAEIKMIAELNPEVMVCEPTELIGTGQVSSLEYIQSTNKAVKDISPETLVLQAAGISTPDDVYNTLMAGADGTGGTSGIVCAADPCAILEKMLEGLVKARSELNK